LAINDDSLIRIPAWGEITEVMNVQHVAVLLEDKFQHSTEWKRNPIEDPISSFTKRTTCYKRIFELMRADPVVSGEYLEGLMAQSIRSRDSQWSPNTANRYCYNKGTGDFKFDEQTRKVFERFMVLLTSCILEDKIEIVFTEKPLLGPFGEQAWKKRPRNSRESFQRLRDIFAE
jgi:hypothetical protein